MSRNIILRDDTGGNGTAKSDLTVPSENRDIRLVAETERRTLPKRKFSKGKVDMAKESKTNARPVRKVKLNRSIFNDSYEKQPSFRVKTLDEVKHGRQGDENTTGMSIEVNINSTVTAPSVDVVVEPVMPNTAVDTRNVTQLNPVKNLMLPTIQLTRIGSGNYTRSITKTISPRKKPRKIIMSEAALARFRALKAKLTASQQVSEPLEASPMKKRKISPVRAPDNESQSACEAAYSMVPLGEATDLMVPLGVPTGPKKPASHENPASPENPLSPQNPPSPPLSLGAQSDHELDDDVEPESELDARVVLNSGDKRQKSPDFKPPPRQRSFQFPTGVGLNLSLGGVADDKLDVMSIMADDDELFEDDRQRQVLKRSLSQDSVFDNSAEKDDRGDLRSLLVKPNDGGSNMNKSVGDLILSGSVSKHYKIPLVNQTDEKTPVGSMVNNLVGGRNKLRSDTSTDFISGRDIDRGGKCYARAPSHSLKRTDLTQNQVGGMIAKINFYLDQGNVQAAWVVIKRLDQAKYNFDVRLLEETLKVCERVSQTKPNPVLGPVILGVFELIKRIQGEAKPTDFILVILSLCRCRRVGEGFDKYLAMKSAGKLPPDDVFDQFIDVLCKCLVFMPHKLIELLQDVINFSLTQQRKIHLVNNCVASLISNIPKQLKKVDPEKWNSLLIMLCNHPSYIQSTLQVHNIMEKIAIPLSPPALYQLFKVIQESKATKPLLKLICSKATRCVLVEHKPPVDVTQIIMNPNVKAREVEECLSSLVIEGAMPDDEILHQFIAKALLKKDYAVIYQFFLNCKRSAILLSLPVLKQMMEALENWDENANASVEVYAALRVAKKGPKYHVPTQSKCYSFSRTGTCHRGNQCKFLHTMSKDHRNSSESDFSGRESVGEGKSVELDGEYDQKQTQFGNKPVKNGPQFSTGVCFKFLKYGHCWNGDRCHYAHSRQSSDHRPENRPQESVGDSQSTDLGSKSDQKPNLLVSNSTSTLHNSGPSGVVNKPMVNGTIPNQPRLRLPFPSFQVLGPGTINHRAFKPQMFGQLSCNRLQFNPLFRRNVRNPMLIPGPRSGIPGPRGNHIQPRDLGKQFHQDAGKLQHGAPITQRSSSQHSLSPVTGKPKVGRSFSWEPNSNVKSNLHNGLKVHPNPQFDTGSDSNNNAKGVTKLHQQVDVAIKCKQWQTVHACYIECKGASSQHVASKDLLMFRNSFVKNSGSFGQNFSAFIEYLYKENCTGESCNSGQSVLDVFDQYDIDFIGALGVSLMEKCLVGRQFNEGYEVLLCLHSHSISYFQSGKNFGAYIKDIPPQNVALIAVKLCLGLDQHGGLGAMEVLRACDYALAKEGELVTPQDKEYRIKVLHQLYLHLFKEGHVLQCFEVLQKLNAGNKFEGAMYNQVLNHFVAADDFDQSFTVLDEMQKKEMELNIPPCHSLYEKFLKHCIESHEHERATDTIERMESTGISGGVFRSILRMLSSSEQDPLVNLLFKKCIDLKIYPNTFCLKTPWLCELGCGYSQQELKLLICKYLEQLHCYLLSTVTSDQMITAVKDLQIIMFPHLSGFNTGLNITDGIQAPLDNGKADLAKVLQEDFNPPLAILEQSSEQFHRKIIIEKMSVYRWFCANTLTLQQSVDGQEEFETSSEGSVASDVTAC